MRLPKLKFLAAGGIRLSPPYVNLSPPRTYQRYAKEGHCLNRKVDKLMRSNNPRTTVICKKYIRHDISNENQIKHKVFGEDRNPPNRSKIGIAEEGTKRSVPLFLNDKLLYNHIVLKLMNREKKMKNISSDFFYHLNKFHINHINNYFGQSRLIFTKTSKIFFAVVASFSVLLTFFLVTSSNYLEYNIILKYHIKFHSLLFSFFSAYYLGLQVGSYYFVNNLHYMYTFLFLVASIISMSMADYAIWVSYYFLSLNYLAFIVINYCNVRLGMFPSCLFQNVNRVFFFSLLSNYLAVNKGKYIEQNIQRLRDEEVDTGRFRLFKVLPYFL
ncbi:conserved Plasmodium protein, unknown function [Plasmodium knowlesi strain H]|uniref:Uncharacterized protein n=3 Tax=Plasmodium knowlesi TaxID=5850 RepID=A0A5K1UWM1_PLAKH|nr:conserved Plasmodium protein, unknown function [Plasmodium knowlesi strain H]OTN64527.1 Uncharacterized protein PKNOH_S130190800 [Plasmodium knowlesi]CAA9989071.1 conserved Plasmodium protein, unknown function [Plasmodium knowlesi strain H]SBO27283.1 conserved Plasmodium protein, unknown function [Plasmodium knowlesi strain H]SBO28911.1 conserved Plasmodium protein, unknown function [Plasmodium knowlesi strain H]VVS78545.1 conserved Plasmodium protein, unknown function [Plasmodium knowlesi |eukprot:XP_002261420.1 hypothetical protein, conserved in Plasmodium species [Plasmodium knowlesi strain H]